LLAIVCALGCRERPSRGPGVAAVATATAASTSALSTSAAQVGASDDACTTLLRVASAGSCHAAEQRLAAALQASAALGPARAACLARLALSQARDRAITGVLLAQAPELPLWLGAPEAELRAVAVEALVQVPAEVGIPAALVALRDLTPGVRAAALHALARLAAPADVVVRVAVRPATSIGKPQTMAKAGGGTETVAIEGRHDPCICPRVVPVAEAMLAVTLMDAWLRQRALRGRDR